MCYKAQQEPLPEFTREYNWDAYTIKLSSVPLSCSLLTRLKALLCTVNHETTNKFENFWMWTASNLETRVTSKSYQCCLQDQAKSQRCSADWHQSIKTQAARQTQLNHQWGIPLVHIQAVEHCLEPNISILPILLCYSCPEGKASHAFTVLAQSQPKHYPDHSRTRLQG